MSSTARLRGLIAHIDPETNDVHAMTHGRRSDSLIGMLKIDDHGRHYVHIERTHVTLADDPRLQDGRITEKGPFLLLHPQEKTGP